MASPKHPHLSRISSFIKGKAFIRTQPATLIDPKFRVNTSPLLSKKYVPKPPSSPPLQFNGSFHALRRHHSPPQHIGFREFLERERHIFRNRRSESRSEATSSLQTAGLFGTIAAFGTSLYADAQTRRMKERLNEHDLVEKPIEGDGNCQFRAIADQIHSDETRHRDVRENLVSWLRKNPHYPVDEDGTKISDFLESDRYGSWENYCNMMSRDRYWGDQMTLLAASEVYKAKVFVLSSVETPANTSPVTLIEPKGCRPERTIRLSHYHEHHYNSLYPRTGAGR
eukprot:TRINITY_DN10988_c0_g1_i2.p1 TRINITY_DN10988_c0_g1~~TRINITY_DN10988_c0_g1_i2.p1  ORF type:complete len:306 (-),score=15.02 TRINITY_DN10988_c0_g1_i2:226-1074(-)